MKLKQNKTERKLLRILINDGGGWLVFLSIEDDDDDFWFFVVVFSVYLCWIGIRFSPSLYSSAGNGDSTVNTPSFDKLERINSGFVPFGNKNSRLYSR